MKHLFGILLTECFLLTSVVMQGQPSIGGFHVYYGHLHNHSNVSDGEKSPEEAYDYALHTQELDFF